MSSKSQTMRRLALGMGLSAMAWLAVSCGNRTPPVRHYTEVSEPPAGTPMGRMGPLPARPAAAAASPMEWDTPGTWREEAGTGMRLASFAVGGPDQPAEVSLTALSGAAGGVEANVRRWLDQLGAPPESDASLTDFLSTAGQTFETPGGETATLVDFTSLAAEDTAASMLAAIIPLTGKTVFVKMTGPAAVLREERARMRAFAESIRMAP